MPAEENDEAEENGATRVKMRLPKAEVERLMKESKDDGEIAARIMDLCMAKNNANNGKLIMNNEIIAKNKWKSGSTNYHQTITTGVKAREVKIYYYYNYNLFKFLDNFQVLMPCLVGLQLIK